MARKIGAPRTGFNEGRVVSPSTWEYLDALTADMKPYKPELTAGMEYGSESKYLTWDFTGVKGIGQLELLHITDTQFGHKFCNVERMIEYRDWVLEKPSRYMLWGGDMIDAWALWSPGTAWDQIGAPDSQLYKFVELWAPARHRILGYVGGNHERRAIKGFGDLGILIAQLLKLPYSGGRQLIDINFGAHKPFKVSLWHGGGSASTKGSIANVVHRFMMQGDSQLYLVGHLHQAEILPDWREIRSPGDQSIELQKIVGAISTSFLDTWGTYGEVAGFRSTDVMMARTVLEKNGHWEVTLR